MKRTFWDRTAKIYDRFMRKDRKAYEQMYDLIYPVVRCRQVLELATGTGLIAKHIAGAADHIEATDASPKMIEQARRGSQSANLHFSVQDMLHLPYADEELQFDRTCHVLYSKPCRKQIQEKIALHYPTAERETVWERVQRQYAAYLSDWRTDLGGSKNFHNGTGGTYDCIALMSYYTVCKAVTSVAEIEEMENELFQLTFRKLTFVDCNKPFWKRILHWSFAASEKKCNVWHDYEMSVAPYDKDKPIYYEFTACPIAEFAKQHDLLEAMPAMCNPDYAAMELLHARLVRTTTCAIGCRCDYTICGDRDEYVKEHPEYVDEQGFRRNKI